MEMNDQLFILAATPGKRVLILIEEEGGWNPRARMDTLEKRKKISFHCQESKHDALVGHHVA
jgi:hypothetical protein